MSCFVYFRFLIPIQILSSTYYIDSFSNTYSIHIHIRSNSYPLHILLYQTKLLCIFPVLLPIHPLQIQFICISDWIHIRFRSNSYPLHILLYQTKLLCVFPAFTPDLPISDPIHINFRSNTYIHFRSITYMFELLCVFPVFTPNPDFMIHLFHGNCVQHISSSYPLQIKFISFHWISEPQEAISPVFPFSENRFRRLWQKRLWNGVLTKLRVKKLWSNSKHM